MRRPEPAGPPQGRIPERTARGSSTDRRATAYQLLIEVAAPLRCTIGRLGRFAFPAGLYVYTGSARRNLEARIARHLQRDKALRWHIDYLLAARGVRVVKVVRSRRGECALNRAVRGRIVCAGFGASDCQEGCGAHLKFLDPVSRSPR